MSINHLIVQNLKKNIKNYFLYIFALIFTVALYFAFVTLQYDPAMDATKGSVKGEASIRAASVLLVAIVTIFLLYANNIFIKRRSKEIGLLQLIGMRKSKIFRILTLENLILYSSSLAIGVFVGFSVSRLFMLILFKITDVEADATLSFSTEALTQTIVVFACIYLLIMLMNYLFIKKQSILSLFRVRSSTEENNRKVTVFEMLYGTAGILLILFGYYLSSRLFNGDFTSINGLFIAMLCILASVILGTYLFYKGSVRFLFYIIRKKKDGYLNISEVLSLSTIMFRMKSNALLLTIITTVSALAIGLLSLSYISLYSAEQMAKDNVAADFALASEEDAQQFKQALQEGNIAYTDHTIEVIQANVNVEQISEAKTQVLELDPNIMLTPVIRDSNTELDVAPGEVYFTGSNDLLRKMLPLKDSGTIELLGMNNTIPLTYLGMRDEFYVSYYYTSGGVPLAVVDDSVFEQLKQDLDPELQKGSSLYIGITIDDESQLEKANEAYKQANFMTPHESRLEMSSNQKRNMGLIMFIVGFLGLSFLVTSGCILYFKQMDESEEEKPNYTILRKLGFTQGDLLKGIQAKQLFNFGIPLVIGLAHSYFAVKSGWFMFGTELWTPMVIVMLLYTVLYSIFAFLSVLYYKKVIKASL
ncbi:ABC transporter permease [Paenibacillus camelliae]|uniref:ABC transporter permease n=1 Tax=Paenibacillus camelliae TaxID=512410 RepID=UPI00204078A4|nr:ABC transporter permease [Paenibacillus camelliae]MCM3633398.1 ABC transporter permease [Paenibacillus camelliae]